MFPDTQIISDRLILKAYTDSDSQNFYHLLSENKKDISNSFPTLFADCIDEQSTLIHIKQRQKEWADKKTFAFGIFLKDTLNLIGHIVIRNIDQTIPKCELGYLISSKHQGYGFATESLISITNQCFEKLGMEKVFLRIITDNLKSKKVAEKAGYYLEGILKNEFRTFDKQLVDLAYYGKTK